MLGKGAKFCYLDFILAITMKQPKDKAPRKSLKQKPNADKTKAKRKKSINLAVLGLGTVGKGVLALLQDNADEMARRTGYDIKITHVGVRKKQDGLDGITQTSDLLALVADPLVDIVIEVIGGDTVAKEVILAAIAHKKHIVTANKALLAKHGNEIFARAEAHGVRVAYEAAVGGGIPIIKALREALAANQINWLAGIINGTSNFILTQMQQENQSFDKALKDAQKLGYAEADPTFDVEGVDAAHKLALLSAMAFGVPIAFDKVYCEGISQLHSQDIQFAKKLGYHIKHLGQAIATPRGLELRVHPTLIKKEQMLAHVHGVKNAVLVDAHPVGQTLYYGDGAGAGATASAVMADVMDLVRTLADGGGVPHLAFAPDALKQIPIVPSDRFVCRYYLRVMALGEISVLASITAILSEHDINIDAILQRAESTQKGVPIIITTLPSEEAKVNNAIDRIEALPTVVERVARIRIL